MRLSIGAYCVTWWASHKVSHKPNVNVSVKFWIQTTMTISLYFIQFSLFFAYCAKFEHIIMFYHRRYNSIVRFGSLSHSRHWYSVARALILGSVVRLFIRQLECEIHMIPTSQSRANEWLTSVELALAALNRSVWAERLLLLWKLLWKENLHEVSGKVKLLIFV